MGGEGCRCLANNKQSQGCVGSWVRPSDVNVCAYVCLCMRVCVCVCAYVCRPQDCVRLLASIAPLTHTHAHTRTHTHTHTHAHTHSYLALREVALRPSPIILFVYTQTHTLYLAHIHKRTLSLTQTHNIFTQHTDDNFVLSSLLTFKHSYFSFFAGVVSTTRTKKRSKCEEKNRSLQLLWSEIVKKFSFWKKVVYVFKNGWLHVEAMCSLDLCPGSVAKHSQDCQRGGRCHYLGVNFINVIRSAVLLLDLQWFYCHTT